MGNTLKSKSEFKVGDYILILHSQNPYLVCRIKEVHKFKGSPLKEPAIYSVEFPDGKETYLYGLQMRKISKKRYFLEAL